MSDIPRPVPSPSPTTRTDPARRRGLTVIAIVVLLAGVAWATWHWLYARHSVNTDNAYVAGNVVQITPQLPGTVVAILADDNDFVRAGQPLVRLDPTDARVALERAEADLGRTVREVRVLFANDATGKAQVAQRQADMVRTQTELLRAQDDVQRRAPLLASGAVGQEEYQHAKARLANALSGVAAAQAGVQVAQQQLAAGRAQTEGTTLEQHPGVQQAAARVREAFLALQRAELLAPVDGHVAKRGVQLGQRVAAGATMMTLVSLDQLWVDANFKEAQLNAVRIGQSAELEADVYGSKVVFHGKVAGLGAGTGAAFALLPAQNATGNWIKIVQRVPVRITLDPKELAAHPLRLGLSMDVTVDTQDQSGKALANAPRADPVVTTRVFDAQMQASEVHVKGIIAASLGRTAANPASARKVP